MTLHRLFEQQALKYADRIALSFLNEKYTYAEVNAWSNQLARFLQERYAVSSGDRVLMFIPKCATQMVILLALSKLGAIYVPLNSGDCPDEKLIHIMNATEAKCIIVSEIREVMASFPVLSLSVLNSSLQAFSAENLDCSVSEHDIAYMIYTSGTTNYPKSVPIKHLGLNYWFNTMSELFHTTDTDERRVLSFCLASFDASIWEYLMAWVEGSTLYMLDEVTRNDPEKLKAFIEENAITHATLIPSVLRHLVTLGLPAKLQVVCSTGEACTRDIVAAFERSNKQLLNCYGATEETFGLSVQACSLGLFDEKKGAPIAYPVGEDIKVYILDEAMKGAEVGELYVASPYLTPGYWHQEAETEKNFIIRDGLRLYKTGDYFCRDSEQNVLRYIGRVHSEVLKIRGTWVNILEIESCLLTLAGVEDACVIVCKRGNVNFLVAHLQVSSTAQLSFQAIRRNLLQQLHLAAIPAQFLMTTKPLPLTANAKKDRKKLQEDYDAYRHALRSISDFLPIEKALVEIVQEVLEIDKTDIRASDTFFTLGGDSISQLVLIEKLKARFDVDVSVHDLYQDDLTISALVDLIHEYRWIKNSDFLISPIISQGEDTQSLFMLHPITGEASITYYEFAKCLAQQESIPNLRIYGINARGLHHPFDVSMNINLIAADYVRAIQQKQSHGPYFIFGWSFGGVLAWKITELLEQMGEKVRVVLIDTLSPTLAQQCHSALYTEMLCQLIEDLRRYLNIVGDFSNLLESITSLTPEIQIKTIFQALIHANENQSAQLQLMSGLLLANQLYTPKSIMTIPYLFTYPLTQDKARTLMPNEGVNFSSTLGWSSIKQSITLTTLPSVSTHFDFVINREVITSITQFLQEQLLLQKDSDMSHSSDHDILISLQTQLALLTNLVAQHYPNSEHNSSLPQVYRHDRAEQVTYFRTAEEPMQQNSLNQSSSSASHKTRK